MKPFLLHRVLLCRLPRASKFAVRLMLERVEQPAPADLFVKARRRRADGVARTLRQQVRP